MTKPRQCQHGFSYIELMLALTIAALLVAGLAGVTGDALQIGDSVQARNLLTREARFAMQRMVRAVSTSRRLLLPLANNPATNWHENIREETVPATPPADDSSHYTAVLAVTLPLSSDMDNDGIPDADNDRDGRVDEDLPGDNSNDSASGIWGIDDNGNGTADDSFIIDDDGDNGNENEDPVNEIDDDGDGSIDEDAAADMNDDGCPGICGVDDDGDGSIDEGDIEDDDEDGAANEDGYDPVVFYLDNGILKQRTPVPWDESGTGGITGRDFITSDIANNVSRFRVERIPVVGSSQVQSVDLTLELTGPITGETVSLQTRVRVGGAL